MKTYFIFLCLIVSGGFASATTQTTANQDKPPRLYVKSYSMGDGGSANRIYGTIDDWDTTFSGSVHFSDGVAGTGSWTSEDISEDYYTYDFDANWSWSASSWPNVYGTMIQTYFNSPWPNNDSTNTYHGQPPPIIWQSCDINVSTNITFTGEDIVVVKTTERRSAQATIKLQTGGKAISKLKNLFGLTPSATQTSPANPGLTYSIGGDAYSFMYENSSGPGIPSQNISIGSFGKLNASGIKYVALSDNDDVDVTPSVANVDYYSFGVSENEVKTKADWQAVVQNEIDNDNGVQIETYAAGNGFMTNRANVQAVYSFYQKLFTDRPTQFYWAGPARLVGAPVYAGLSDAEYVRQGSITSGFLTLDNLGDQIASALLASKAGQFQTNLMGMQIDVYSDLAWQFEAYRKVGLNALEEVAAGVSNDESVIDIAPWRTLDQGIQQNNVTNIQTGNLEILQREQQQILADGYVNLGNLFPGTTSLMSIFTQNPVLGGPSFSTLEPSGNIANYPDRWDWITRPYTSVSNSGIFPLWLNESSSTRLGDVGQSLLYRAQNDYSLVYEYFGFPIF